MRKVYSSSVECVLIPAETDGAVTPDASGTQKTPIEELNNFLIVGGRAIESLSRLLMAEDTMVAILNNIENLKAQNPGDQKYILESTYTATQLYGLFSFHAPEGDTNLVFTVSCNAYSAHDTYVLLSAFADVWRVAIGLSKSYKPSISSKLGNSPAIIFLYNAASSGYSAS